MDDEKKVIEKRSSFRGWKERNRGKSHEKIYTIGVAAMAVILVTFIIYPYLEKKNDISIPVISANSSNGSNDPSLIKVTPKITSSTITPVVTDTAKNITGKMNIPLVINGFEITVKNVGSAVMYTSIWIVVKNMDNVEKPLKIGSSTVVIDNMGEQYENIHVQRSSEIIQTNLTARAMREGSIFFGPLREGRNAKKLILNINGQKAEIMLEK